MRRDLYVRESILKSMCWLILSQWRDFRIRRDVTGSRSRDYSAGQSVLDSLEARELSLREAKLERVTVVKFRVNKRAGNSFSSGLIEKTADTMTTTDVVEARFREGRNLVGECKMMVEDETQISCG
jgi:hypothetical protein